jgi:hypothetical protein
MFNSPIHFCPVHKKYVALDETHAECMVRHNCEADPCLLAHFFARQALPNGEPAVAKALVIDEGEV